MPSFAVMRQQAHIPAHTLPTHPDPASFVAARPPLVSGLAPASRAHLTPACSGLASLATDARRYAAGISSVGRV